MLPFQILYIRQLELIRRNRTYTSENPHIVKFEGTPTPHTDLYVLQGFHKANSANLYPDKEKNGNLSN